MDSAPPSPAARRQSQKAAQQRRGSQNFSAADGTVLWNCLQEEKTLAKAEALISRGDAGDVNMQDKSFGWSPIHIAANKGRASLIKLLMNAKAQANPTCNIGNTALHLAARGGHQSAVEYLVVQKAELDVRNDNGWTPMIWAAINGRATIVSVLEHSSADFTIVDGDGRTACMWAARHGHESIVRSLLLLGFSLELRDNEGLTLLDHVREHDELRALMAATQQANCKLLDAVRRVDQAAVRSAIEASANVNVFDLDGWSPLKWAAMHKSRDLVRLLVQHGANPKRLERDAAPGEDSGPEQIMEDALDTLLNVNQDLLRAARNGDFELVEDMLQAGGWVNVQEVESLRSCLMWAGRHGDASATTSLANRKALVEQRDAFGWTAILYAVAYGSLETVSSLCYLAADIGVKSYEGDAALHMAAQADNALMIQLILAAKCDVDEQDLLGHTSLQIAIANCRAQAVSTLLAFSANPTVKDELLDRTLIASAVVCGHAPVIRVLLDPLVPPPPIPIEGHLEEVASHASNRSRKSAASKMSGSSKLSRNTAQTSASQRGASPKNGEKKRPPRMSVTEEGQESKLNENELNKLAGKSETVSDGPLTLMVRAHEANNHVSKKLPASPGPSVLGIKDGNGRDVLALAVSLKSQAICELLLHYKAAVDSPDGAGRTALMSAAVNGSAGIVCMLLHSKANHEAKNPQGRRAVDLTKDAVCRELLTHWAIERRLPPGHPAAPPFANEQGNEDDESVVYFRVRLEQLPLSLDRELLKSHVAALMKKAGVAKVATVTKIDIVVDPITERPKGWAYVEFDSDDGADAAVCCDGGKLCHETIRAFKEPLASYYVAMEYSSKD